MMTATRRFTQRDLNRATLARQHLLARTDRSALEVIEDLVGMQSQAPNPPFTGLWSRIEDFQFGELSRLMLERSVARLLLMRGTVHLVTADDALGLRPVMQAPMQREYVSVRAKRLPGVDLDEADRLCIDALREAPRTPKQLGEILAARWPDLPQADLAQIPRLRLALVQIPPRGVWGASGTPTYALAEDWLGAPLEPYSLPAVIRCYLAAFGPATVKDAQQWSGLTRLKPVFEQLEDELVQVDGPNGEVMYDLPNAPRPDADEHAPVRILPEWDNLLLSHADRTRFISDERRRASWTANGIVPMSILVDGEVAALAKIVTAKGEPATFGVHPFEPLSAHVVDELTAEATGLLAAMGDGYAGGAVKIHADHTSWNA